MDLRLYSLASVAAILEAEEQHVLDWLAAGNFPAPVSLPNGEQRWTSAELEAWISKLPAAERVDSRAAQDQQAA